MTAPAEPKRKSAVRFPKPQIAPPTPLKGKLTEFTDAATLAGLELMPWQTHAGRFITAIGKSGWLYPETAIIAPRQNGKTTLLVARIVMGLLAGEKIMHTAQNRELPREIYNFVADVIHPDLMRHPPRKASGQERIDMTNGGVYRIVAPTRGGARGPANDLVIVDEVREFTDFEYIAAAKPTLTVSEHPQIMYLSNAGDDGSLVLNTLRRRAVAGDKDLAYIEWSAPPEYAIDDRKGWKIANPRVSTEPWIMDYLEREYRANLASDTLSLFETEHLSRWVVSMAPRMIGERAWLACRGVTEEPTRPVMAFNMDANGRRASVVRAWVQTDGRIALEEVIEATGDPIDVMRLATDVEQMARRDGVKRIAYASWTDADIARYVPNAKAVDNKEFSAASEQFARYTLSQRVVWDTAGHVTDDLAWTARKATGQDSGAWMAVPAGDRSVTAILAAIRAVWLASAPKPPVPRIG